MVASGQIPVTPGYWVLFNGKEMARTFAELRADQEPLFTQLGNATLGEIVIRARCAEAKTVGGDFAFHLRCQTS